MTANRHRRDVDTQGHDAERRATRRAKWGAWAEQQSRRDGQRAPIRLPRAEP